MARNPLGPGDALASVPLSAPLSREQTAARVELWRRYLAHTLTYEALTRANADPVATLAALDAPPPTPPTPEPAPPAPEPEPHLRWSAKHQQYRRQYAWEG